MHGHGHTWVPELAQCSCNTAIICAQGTAGFRKWRMPQILRRIPSEIYGGAVLTALKRSADMTVEEAIQYKVRAQALALS